MREPSLSRITVTSAVLHLILATLVLIPFVSKRDSFHRPYFVTLTGPFEKQVYEAAVETKIPAKTVVSPEEAPKDIKDIKKETARVPTVVPPKEAPKETKIPAKTVVSPEEAPKDIKDIKKETAKVSKEIERLQAIKTLRKFKTLREKTKDVQVLSASAGHLNEKATQEAKGSPAPTDTKSEENYFSLIAEKIQQQWAYPEFGKSNLEAIVAIKIGVDGKIISRKIEKSSGDPLFDRSVMNAVSKSSPLPSPPREIEVGVRFHQ
ncbi:MAG TPA: hypothetical protein DEP99_04250 [Nitrospiraceae bacterium]|nr:hypothetical protein [Nitrospiraceae bacterium]